MLYFLFIILAIGYNLLKFFKEREVFLSSISNAKNISHREMILSHNFYIFIFECFLSLIVAHLLTEKAMMVGIVGLSVAYITIFFIGLFVYQFLIKYIENITGIDLYISFKRHLFKELRVNFAIILLPILIYSLINMVIQDEVQKDWGNFWVLGLLLNIVAVSLLTIACSTIIMLRLIPNREIVESEYLEIINRRFSQIDHPLIRIRWIEADVKNAFVFGLKLFKFSNQTMFIGRSLREKLTLEEFDAVVAHELGHIVNRHVQKRIIAVVKNFISIISGLLLLVLMELTISVIFFGEVFVFENEFIFYLRIFLMLSWLYFNYYLLFDTYRSNEFEADGYAIIELGVNLACLKSALEKLSLTDELPDYLRDRIPAKENRNAVIKWLAKKFSTHPELDLRISSIENKISRKLPFNYYVSTTKMISNRIYNYFSFKVVLPLAAVLGLSFIFVSSNFQTVTEAKIFIEKSNSVDIINNETISKKINARSHLTSPTLMYYIVMKKDEKLIDYFVNNAYADKGKTLLYISQLKDDDLFLRYYFRYQKSISRDEYLVVLRGVASLNFTAAYKIMVNDDKYLKLDSSYRNYITTLYSSRGGNVKRMPSSIKN